MTAADLPLVEGDVRIADVEGAAFCADGRELPGWAHGDVELAVAGAR